MYFVEIRAGVRRSGPPLLVPLDDVHRHTGFRSICAFDSDLAQFIHDQGSTENLRGQPVYADTLFVDFDGTDPSEFREHLRASSLAYREYDSGNRSVHFHVPLVPVFGAWVPAAMKQYIKRYAPTADTSFYHPAGMYRLPGTYHAKRPGRCKVLIDVHDGAQLSLAVPAKSAPIMTIETEDPEEATGQLFRLLTQAKGPGHRSAHIWLLSTSAAEAGLSFDEALDHLRFWNERFASPPHDEAVLIKQCESAYRRAARREA